MLKISIVRLGHFKREINFRLLRQWKSDIFKITSCEEQSIMPNSNTDIYWQTLSDESIGSVLSSVDGSDITCAITEYSLEGNFYMRHIGNELVVISLSEVGDFLAGHNIPLENYILKNIYEMVSLRHLYGPLPTTNDCIPDIIHDETRRCLFDMDGIKTDIVYSVNRPSLCPRCLEPILITPE